MTDELKDVRDTYRGLHAYMRALAKSNTKLRAQISEFKKHRIYYQTIVYEISCLLDEFEKRKPGYNIVCGTIDNPSEEVQATVKKLIAQIQDIKNALSCAKDIIDGDLAGDDYSSAMAIINRVLEDDK